VQAAKNGFAQILWLFGPDHNITEVGTMNAFAVWKNRSGERELVTAPLDGTILHGVTRDSVLQLAKGWKDIKVVERPFTMRDIIEAIEEKRVCDVTRCDTMRELVISETEQQTNKQTNKQSLLCTAMLTASSCRLCLSSLNSLVLERLPSWLQSRASNTKTRYVKTAHRQQPSYATSMTQLLLSNVRATTTTVAASNSS
jgi:hypothetical protein